MDYKARLKSVEIVDSLYIKNIVNDALDSIPQDEVILVALKGAFREYLICTDKGIYIVKRGFMTRNTFGVGVFKAPYSNVTNAEVVDKVISGYFEISEEGMENTNKSYWNTLGGKGDATHQPNSISLYEKTSKEFFKKASAFILNMVEMSNSESANSILSKNKESSKFDEIIRYKELLDLGIVTEEEFESKKQYLLN